MPYALQDDQLSLVSSLGITRDHATSRRLFANFWLCLLLALDETTIPGASFVVALLYVLFSMANRGTILRIPNRLSVLCVPFLLILVIGLPGFYIHDTGDFLRDGWYFFSPIVTLAFGYFWFERSGDLGDLIDVYSIVGILSSIYSLYSLYDHWTEILFIHDLDRYREVVGHGVMMPIVAMGLIFIARSRGFKDSYVLRRRWLTVLTLTLCFTGIAITFSRTMLLCMLLGYLFSLSKSKLISRIIFVLFVSIVAAPAFSSSSGDGFVSQFIGKITNIGTEVAVHPFQNYSDIQDNWRGYEGFRALKTFEGFDPVHQVFGGGFGQLVDLGLQQSLDYKYFIKVPVLHNGYNYILIKTGIAGEFIFAVFLIRNLTIAWRAWRKPENALTAILGTIMLWILVVLILTQGVVMGIYSKEYYQCVTVLIGICVAGMRQPWLIQKESTLLNKRVS